MQASSPIDTVVRYIKGCNAGDIDMMMSTFTDDVMSYFVDRPPVRGSTSLAQMFKALHDTTGARWTVDHAMAAGHEVVMEWSQLWTRPGTSQEEFSRGVDWFHFKGNAIAEIHQYYRARNLGPDEIYELQGFPYTERNYAIRADMDSRLP